MNPKQTVPTKRRSSIWLRLPAPKGLTLWGRLATQQVVGSLNGGEVSHKLNRELVLMVDAPALYDRLAGVFAWD
jgi:hypothetical protein